MQSQLMRSSRIGRRAPQMDPEARRRQLLDVAIHVFATRGIDGANHGHVARAAGVSVPTVHSYFKTRHDLISAVLNAVRRYIIDEAIRPFTSRSSFEERMMISGKNLIASVPLNSDYFKVWIMWHAHFGDNFQSQYQDFEKEAVEFLYQLLTGDSASEQQELIREKALVLLGLSIFLTQMILRGESIEKQERFVRNVIQAIKIWI